MINRQCPECGGYEMDDGTSDLCYCYEVGSDECDTLKADLDRHKRAVEYAKESYWMRSYQGNIGKAPTLAEFDREIDRILEGKE